MSKPKPGAMVLVEWVDPVGMEGWRTPGDVRDETPARCLTLGWLVIHDGEVLKVASTTQTNESHVADVHVIPTSCVHAVTEVRTK